MRVSILVAPRIGFLLGTFFPDGERCAVLAADRVANGQAFPGETRVRLPRRWYKGPANGMNRYAAEHPYQHALPFWPTPF